MLTRVEPAMKSPTFDAPAWLLRGLFGRVAGTLKLAGGRLVFTSDERVVLLDARVDDLSVRLPWYYFGGGVVVTVGDARYRLSFVEPGENGDMRSGRAACRTFCERIGR